MQEFSVIISSFTEFWTARIGAENHERLDHLDESINKICAEYAEQK